MWGRARWLFFNTNVIELVMAMCVCVYWGGMSSSILVLVLVNECCFRYGRYGALYPEAFFRTNYLSVCFCYTNKLKPIRSTSVHILKSNPNSYHSSMYHPYWQRNSVFQITCIYRQHFDIQSF